MSHVKRITFGCLLVPILIQFSGVASYAGAPGLVPAGAGFLVAADPAAKPAEQAGKSSAATAAPAGKSIEQTSKTSEMEISPQKQPGATTSKKTISSGEAKVIVRYSVLLGVPLATYLFAWLSWDWGNVSSEWKWANEGWFGPNTYAGGADKCGHMFSHYAIFRMMYAIFNYTEEGRYTKWIYSVLLPTVLAVGIELGDAFCHSQNGFGYQDIIMDFLGIGLGVIMEKFPIVDSFLSFSVQYFPSKYFRDHLEDIMYFVDDYSGWKFLFSFKLAGFRDLGYKMPAFLRYVQFDLGYYTRGYTEYDAKAGETEKSRNIFIGFSINMVEVVDDMFPEKNKNIAYYVKQPFKYIHIPVGYSYSFNLDE